jgi:hypothetical protein
MENEITIDSLKECFGRVVPKGLPRYSPDWKILFDFYNKNRGYSPPLQMTCMSCFPKVYFFIKSYLTNHEKQNAKEIKKKVMSAMYNETDIKSHYKDILKDPQFKSVYRGAKKNYTRHKVVSQ